MVFLPEVTLIIQQSLTPVTFISGVGLVMISMTNRYVRLMDRARSAQKYPKAIRKQAIQFLYKRARILKKAIMLSCLSIMAAVSLIVVQFLGLFLQLPLGVVAIILFLGSFGLLVSGLTLLLYDYNLSLKIMELEFRHKKYL